MFSWFLGTYFVEICSFFHWMSWCATDFKVCNNTIMLKNSAFIYQLLSLYTWYVTSWSSVSNWDCVFCSLQSLQLHHTAALSQLCNVAETFLMLRWSICTQWSQRLSNPPLVCEKPSILKQRKQTGSWQTQHWCVCYDSHSELSWQSELGISIRLMTSYLFSALQMRWTVEQLNRLPLI